MARTSFRASVNKDLLDVDVIRQIKLGDESAFRELVRRYLRPGMVVAIEFVRNREDAEDVMQEVFRRVHSHIGSFDLKREFAPWFYTIVRNECRTLMKSKWHRHVAGLESTAV